MKGRKTGRGEIQTEGSLTELKEAIEEDLPTESRQTGSLPTRMTGETTDPIDLQDLRQDVMIPQAK